MSARILVVDDNPINLKLLEARLTAEYFDVVKAAGGEEALRICRSESLDLVLCDVMMPGIDGFEFCRRLKADPQIAHLPIVLITALDEPRDRVRGLEAGADDFLTKPVRNLPLLSRVRSLTRLKQMTDELRRRAETASDLLAGDAEDGALFLVPQVFVVGDDPRANRQIARAVSKLGVPISFEDQAEALEAIREAKSGLAIVDLTTATGSDPLRFLARCRQSEQSRSFPIIAVAAPDDDETAAKALELGAHDYVQRPIDPNELIARARTQLARHRHSETLRHTVERTLELAVIDGLTGLHNRRFLNAHLARAVEHARVRGTTFALILADIDHFKKINDTYGHDDGDLVLREFAKRIEAVVRASDLACRMGGEEFAILLPNASERDARSTAERFRASIEKSPFLISGTRSIRVTVSVGLSIFPANGSDMRALMRAADSALYRAKNEGRNRVAFAA